MNVPVVAPGALFRVVDLINLQSLTPLSDLRCEVRLSKTDVAGDVRLEFGGEAPETLVIQFCRDIASGCGVVPDPSLTLWGTNYSLRAILLHQANSDDGGHCIMYLRNSTTWELRNDERVALCGFELPPFIHSEARVLV